MTPETLLLVISAGVLHALTHVLIKLGDDKFLVYAVVNLVGFVVAVPMWVLSTPMKTVPTIAIAISIALHQLYKVFVIASYSATDLNRAFPVARGSAPVLVFIGSIVFLGESFTMPQLFGVALIMLGLSLLIFQGSNLELQRDYRGVFFALLTGMTTAGYTLLDGQIVREVASPFRFVALLYIFDGLLFPLAAVVVRKKTLWPFLRQNYLKASVAGLLALVSYGAVVYAMQSSQIGLVAVLREISIVVAALLGGVLMRERLGWQRTMASAVVFVGILFVK